MAQGLSAGNAFAAEDIKINGLKFDNSDNLIFIQSNGVINLKKETAQDTAEEDKISSCIEIDRKSVV